MPVHTVTVLKGTPVDDGHGNTILDWTNPTRAPLGVYAIAPRAGEEPRLPGRQAVIVGKTVYALPGADVAAVDRVEIDGEVHTVEGEPGVWTSPFTDEEKGVEIALRRVEG